MNEICPLCSGLDYINVLDTRDHSVTQENFKIVSCRSCNLHRTYPIPNENDIGLYYASSNYISHHDHSTNAVDYIYLKIRTLALKWKVKLIRRRTDGDRLLDYGCGTGEFLKYCSSVGYITTGFEPTEIARTIASVKNSVKIIAHPKAISGTFDVITLWHVLEHVHQLNEAIARLSNLLASSGTLFIAVPNHAAWDAQHYKEYWAAYDTPRHLWHFDKTSMNELLKKHALKITEVIPMKLDSYYVSLLSERYRSNYKSNILAMIKGAFYGFRSNLKASSSGEYSSLIYVVKHA